MRTPLVVLFLTASVFSVFWRVSFCYGESPWQPVFYDYYHIDLGELGGHHGHGIPTANYGGGYGSKVPIPRDAIVDVINDLGIKLLAIHNEHNENNIAISPYGAFSVLAALSEGLQGDSGHEILHAAQIPKDKHILRVGLRDIHRHLKSYFIPEEGFLAGLTLNLNNVTLKSEYEDVLRFYGFDYGSFNNALYPEPLTTKKPSEGTTLETGLSMSEDTTIVPITKEESTTTDILTRLGEPSSESPMAETTTELESTSTILTTIESKGVMVVTQQQSTQPSTTVETTTIPQTTIQKEIDTTRTETTTQTVSTTNSDLTPTSETTVKELLETSGTFAEKVPATTEQIITTTKESTTEAQTTTQKATTENTVTPTTPLETTTKITETTTVVPINTTTETVSTTKETTTQEVTTTQTTTLSSVTSTKSPETTLVPTTLVTSEETTISTETTTVIVDATMISDANTLRTTRQVTMVPENSLTTLPSTETTITPQTTFTSNEMTTTQTEVPTTMESLEDSTVPLIPLNETGIQNEFVNAPDNTPPLFGENIETTTPFFLGTTPDFQDMTDLPQNQDSFDFNYNYDANNVPPVYDDNMVNNNVTPNTPGDISSNNNFKRSARSVVDYVIARFYDDPHEYPAPPPQRPQYIPREPLTFAVYGKYRESGIHFMKYDTVLPYFFVPKLNAIALSFPLDSSKYYLLLLLPLRDNGVDQLICDLRLHGNLRYIIDNLRLTHVVATIPSFMLKGYVTLTPALQRLGIRKIFEPRQADFSPMTNETDIYVTNIEQAVTVTIRNYLDPSSQRYKNFRQYPPVNFKADHPFLYFVIDSELHVALMVGKVINPLNSRIR